MKKSEDSDLNALTIFFVNVDFLIFIADGRFAENGF